MCQEGKLATQNLPGSGRNSEMKCSKYIFSSYFNISSTTTWQKVVDDLGVLSFRLTFTLRTHYSGIFANINKFRSAPFSRSRRHHIIEMCFLQQHENNGYCFLVT